MSIVIHGVEMPKVCGQCQIKLGIDCELWKHVRSVGLDRHRDCPLDPIPPHGRLVEDTAVIDQIDEWFDSVGTVFLGHGMSYYGELIGCVEDAPTIIPAEKSNRV